MKPKRLPNTDFMAHAPLSMNEEVNVNHENCSAGVDRKARLYVKRVEGGVVAYCHHCGGAGYFMEGKSRMRYPKHVTMPVPEKPEDKYDIKDFGFERPTATSNHIWLGKYLADREPSMNNVVLSNLYEANKIQGAPLLFPIFDPYHQMYGWQLRWTDGRKPKTKTYLNSKPQKGAWYGHGNSLLVVVEDPMSALIVKAAMGTNVRVLCLLGTNLSPGADINILTIDPQRVVVWLDPDDAGKSAACLITHRISYMVGNDKVANITGAQPQPKECFNIAEVLNPYV